MTIMSSWYGCTLTPNNDPPVDSSTTIKRTLGWSLSTKLITSMHPSCFQWVATGRSASPCHSCSVMASAMDVAATDERMRRKVSARPGVMSEFDG
jgi:hypothetical protein